MLERLLKTRNRLRFTYQRSFSSCGYGQVRRYLENLVRRPPASHPRRFVSIGLTHRCQQRCEWCATGAFRKHKRGELTTAEVEGLLRQVAGSRFVFDNISFIGGECLLRPDIVPLVQSATRLGLFVHISSNGLLLDEAMVGRLLGAGLNSAFVAWPLGPSRDQEERRRRWQVRRGVEACVARGLPCFFSVCVNRGDVPSGRVERALRQARRLGAAGVRLMPVRRSGRWLFEEEAAALTPAEERRLRRLCRGGYAFITDDCSAEEGARCPAVRGDLAYISPYGDVHPCHFFPYSFGDLRAEPMDRVLERMWSHQMVDAPGYTCLLHDPAFRARHIDPISRDARLPIAV